MLIAATVTGAVHASSMQDLLMEVVKVYLVFILKKGIMDK
jgi:hypothetical protein